MAESKVPAIVDAITKGLQANLQSNFTDIGTKLADQSVVSAQAMQQLMQEVAKLLGEVRAQRAQLDFLTAAINQQSGMGAPVGIDVGGASVAGGVSGDNTAADGVSTAPVEKKTAARRTTPSAKKAAGKASSTSGAWLIENIGDTEWRDNMFATLKITPAVLEQVAADLLAAGLPADDWSAYGKALQKLLTKEQKTVLKDAWPNSSAKATKVNNGQLEEEVA